jgi:uncharacterized membrane protein (DUF485 family)
LSRRYACALKLLTERDVTNTTRHISGLRQDRRAGSDRPATNPFEGSPDPPTSLPNEPIDFAAIHRSDDFVRLRARLVRFVFPVTALFLGWYLCYVLLAAYARSFMGFQLIGEINIGLVLGLLQFVSTAVITVCYVRFARKNIDPAAERIRRAAGVHAP